jgi:hypothetical protein
VCVEVERKEQTEIHENRKQESSNVSHCNGPVKEANVGHVEAFAAKDYIRENVEEAADGDRTSKKVVVDLFVDRVQNGVPVQVAAVRVVVFGGVS